ncbi:MAG: DUF167 family protein [Thermodesulfobacteriota bacterium]|nr:DUF167 family protein [Thermodesulfobacteriota bacterium]
MTYLKEENNGKISLSVHVQPKAAHNRIDGLHGDRIKLRITAPPVDGKANTAVIGFVAKLFNIPKSAVFIKSGKQSRDKKLSLSGISMDKARKIIETDLWPS